MDPRSDSPQLTELGCYVLAGHAAQPHDLLGEVADAERIGLGAAFVSERFNTKDACALAGAVGAVSRRLGVATAVTNHSTRHPSVTATFGVTMHRLTGGRFCLGLGRGIDLQFDVMGVGRTTSAQLADAVGLYRRLWQGELVVGHDGPLGRYPLLCLDPSFREEIPVLVAAMGPRTLELAGGLADAVVLHTFLGDEATAGAVAAVRRGAERAGRDPASVRVWAVLATVGDHLPEPLRLRKLAGRLGTYLQGYGDLLVRVNGWDPAALERFRSDPLVVGFGGAIDATDDVGRLAAVAELLPADWLAAAATGSPEACAAGVAHQFDLGVDSVILHGATPVELEPVVAAYRLRRPPRVNGALPANPGWSAHRTAPERAPGPGPAGPADR